MIFKALRARGIGVNVHYIPVHLQPYYRALGFKPGQFPVAEKHAISAMSLPLFALLTDVQQDQVVNGLREVLED
jgi:dTDP-4-amino-4,6-dideoxygalactose transaminase